MKNQIMKKNILISALQDQKKYIHPAKACIIGYKKNENVEIAIIGDSHLAALAYPLDLYLNDKKLNAYLLTANGCPTSMNLYNFSDNRFHCKNITRI